MDFPQRPVSLSKEVFEFWIFYLVFFFEFWPWILTLNMECVGTVGDDSTLESGWRTIKSLPTTQNTSIAVDGNDDGFVTYSKSKM